MSQANIQIFITRFNEAENMKSVMQAYESFKNNDMIEEEEYLAVRKGLEKTYESWESEEYKCLIFAYLKNMTTLLTGGSFDDEGTRQQFIDCTYDSFEKMSCIYEEKEQEPKYFLVSLTIDLLFSFWKYSDAVQASAMIYTLFDGWIKRDEDFCVFYGDRVEEEILRRTHKNIESMLNVKNSLSDIEGRDYVNRFCGELIRFDEAESERRVSVSYTRARETEEWRQKKNEDRRTSGGERRSREIGRTLAGEGWTGEAERNRDGESGRDCERARQNTSPVKKPVNIQFICMLAVMIVSVVIAAASLNTYAVTKNQMKKAEKTVEELNRQKELLESENKTLGSEKKELQKKYDKLEEELKKLNEETETSQEEKPGEPLAIGTDESAGVQDGVDMQDGAGVQDGIDMQDGMGVQEDAGY